jgi:hypothetical protein
VYQKGMNQPKPVVCTIVSFSEERQIHKVMEGGRVVRLEAVPDSEVVTLELRIRTGHTFKVQLLDANDFDPIASLMEGEAATFIREHPEAVDEYGHLKDQAQQEAEKTDH